MSSSQQKRPLDNDENTINQQSKKQKHISQYTLEDCISIPKTKSINEYIINIKQLHNRCENSYRSFEQKLLQQNCNYQEILHKKFIDKNISTFLHSLTYVIDDILLVFIQMNIYYIYYTIEDSTPYIKLLNLSYQLFNYFNFIYDVNNTSDYSNIKFIYEQIYKTIKYTKFINFRNQHSYYSIKNCMLIRKIFSIHNLIESINNLIINYNFIYKGRLVYILQHRKLNYNFIHISKQIHENYSNVIQTVELNKLKKYINNKWFLNSKNYVEIFKSTQQKLTTKIIIDDIKINYIPKLKINKNDFIQRKIKETVDRGLNNVISTIDLLINNLNKEVLEYIATFKKIKNKISRYNYNGNLDNLHIQYYFRGKMNIIRDPQFYLNNITLSKLYKILEINKVLPYGTQSCFNIVSNYKKYSRIIPNFDCYFMFPANNPYWSIKNNIYPNNALILTILCMNTKNYYNSTKVQLPYLPEELWFLIFSFLKLSEMCGDLRPQPKILFD